MTSDFAAQPYVARLRPGSRVAGYVIEEQIGTGGMAVVFRARDEVLGRLAAVKVMSSALAANEEFRVRFLRESRAVASVDEPHVIPVYGAGQDSGLLYIATRFVAGGDLAALLRRAGGRLEPERAVSLISQVAAALDAAHAAGLVHRDVKPGNILVETAPGRDEHAYLSDFGLSKGSLSSTGLTSTGQFLGTPDYCPPEQIRGGAVDGRADQYALACVAFVLLAGVLPFRRADTMAVLYAHCNERAPSLVTLRPGLPAAADGVVARALAKSPADRYRTCAQFADALRDALLPAGQPHAPAGRRAWPRDDDLSPTRIRRNTWPPPVPREFPPPGPPPGSGGRAGPDTVPTGHTAPGTAGPGTRARAGRNQRGRRRVIRGGAAAVIIAAAVGAALTLQSPSGSAAGNGPPAPARGSGTATPARNSPSPAGSGGAAAPAYVLVTPLPAKAGGYPLSQAPNDLANATATAQQIIAAVKSGGGGTVQGNPESGAYTLPFNQALTFVGYQGTFNTTKIAEVLQTIGTDPNAYPAGTHGGVLGCANTTTTPIGAVCVWATASTLGITEFYAATGPETLNTSQPKGAQDVVKVRADVEMPTGTTTPSAASATPGPVGSAIPTTAVP